MNLKLSLTASMILGQNKQVHHQSKQQFFTIKKSTRRSKAFQDHQQKTPNFIHQQSLAYSQSYSIIKRLQNLDVKELHYSLAETEDPDALLEFKTVQPKKRKLPSKIYSTNQQKIYSPSKCNEKLSLQKKFKRTNRLKSSMENNQQQLLQKSNLKLSQNGQKQQEKRQKIPFYSPKKIISKTVKSLFSNKVQQVQQKQFPDLSIKDFYIIKQIGQGTYSKVYQAVHKKTQFICALKILQKKLIKELKVEENAIREIKILSCISSHSSITSLYGSFTDQNFIYMILQLCTDGDVGSKMKIMREKAKMNQKQSLQKRKSLELTRMTETVHILRQICSGLKFLHEHSIMHRDIKPENILVTMGNNIKMSDFGWSVCNPKDSLRKTLCGTPLYLAPQFITTCRYNDAVDIWSLGIMAYEFFTNQFPFQIKSVNDLIKIAQDQIEFEKIKCPIARDFCKKALVKDRHFRADIWELDEHELFILYKWQQ